MELREIAQTLGISQYPPILDEIYPSLPWAPTMKPYWMLPASCGKSLHGISGGRPSLPTSPMLLWLKFPQCLCLWKKA